MSDESKKRPSWEWIVWALLAAIVLHPLSMPPVSKLAKRLGCLQIVEPIYEPLSLPCRLSPLFGSTLWWYANKWNWPEP
jgi:hypothetical protein